MTTIASTSTTILDLPPSCIEVCPWDQSVIAVGTYHLEKKDDAEPCAGHNPSIQKRRGSILIFQFSDDCRTVELAQTWPTDYAILDLHFPIRGTEKSKNFWTANSTGSLSCYSVSENPSFIITGSSICQQWAPNVLVLAFAFHPTISQVLGATLSDGSVVLCKISESDKVGVQSMKHVGSHDLEAWTLSFDLFGNRCLSGGDDAVLQSICVQNLQEITRCDSIEEDFHPVIEWRNRRIHSAGVTAILPLQENLVLTGSYDDTLRVVILTKPPRLLAEKTMGGGVWRLKLIRVDQAANHWVYDILASCMHAGARIVRITLAKDTKMDLQIDILAQFEEHESMNYGSDFIRRGDEYAILSTSFYDRRLCVWSFHTLEFDTSQNNDIKESNSVT
ncbi:uncharacterized protein PV09_03539 [Verruconis gallopava]|uniref:Uncharacterized protein n=1 Tax=Verruconis gallopava TaxID=253628 RepID=A0A0D1XSE1_9PEZI|nr:uncharacterized protein PV09_03539 [Verruconis gallopava]KIW05676.1 hypothetical protein PV09_03539 [Verruconis gallopava]